MLRSMLTAFRQHYPQGGLVSELLRIHDGLYIVRAVVVVENQTLATGLAAHGVLETAEDTASVRALSHLGLADIGYATPPTLAVPPTDFPAAHPSPKAPQSVPSVALPTAAMLSTATTKDGAVRPDAAALLPSLDLERAAADFEPETYVSHGPDSTGSDFTLTPEADLSPNLRPVVEPIPAEPTSDAPLPFDPDLLSLEGIPTPSIDLSDIIAQTDVELQRLGWNVNQGREFLEKTYGKRSRHDLTDEELLEFLLFLETQPTPGP
ncbi:MAG: hypothetical protein ACHWZW_10485 [Spirulina sp.]